MRKWYLRKSVGPWSAGTQVEVLHHPDEYEGTETNASGYATVRVLAGNKPVFDIEADYLVERRQREDEITIA